MDADRFDAFARRLVGALPDHSTRRAAGLGLAALLAGLGADAADARRRGCGPCRRRRNGECRPKRDGTRCADCKACRDGRCRNPLPDGTGCPGGSCRGGACTPPPPPPPPPPDPCAGIACPTCQSCAGGACVPVADGTGCAECQVCGAGTCGTMAPDGTTCRGTGQCHFGSCISRPVCSGPGSVCELSTQNCCSGRCVGFACQPSAFGEGCRDSSDCQPGLSCTIFRCNV